MLIFKGDGAIQKGMPHKSYHGNAGIVFNVTQHAVEVIVNKRVEGRIIAKRINVHIEHVGKSRCQEDLIQRIAGNMQLLTAFILIISNKNKKIQKSF